MSELTQEERKQLARDYLDAAQNNTRHDLVKYFIEMDSSGDYKKNYGKVLSDVFVHEIYVFRVNARSSTPRDQSDLFKGIAGLIIEDRVPDYDIGHSKILRLYSSPGVFDRLIKEKGDLKPDLTLEDLGLSK